MHDWSLLALNTSDEVKLLKKVRYNLNRIDFFTSFFLTNTFTLELNPCETCATLPALKKRAYDWENVMFVANSFNCYRIRFAPFSHYLRIDFIFVEIDWETCLHFYWINFTMVNKRFKMWFCSVNVCNFLRIYPEFSSVQFRFYFSSKHLVTVSFFVSFHKKK